MPGVVMDEVFRQLFNSIDEGVIVTDPDGQIIFYNSEMAKLEELLSEQVVGRYLNEVYDAVTVESSEHLSVVLTKEPVLEKHKTYFTNKGKEVTIVASTFPVLEDDQVIAVYSVCKDISKFKELLTKTMQLHDQIGFEGQEPRGNNGTRYTFDSIVYASSVMKDLIASAKKAALADGFILVFGETGTGKELLVQAIHNYSPRKHEPFVAINCAAIPETLLESILFGTTKGAFTGAVESKGLFQQAGNGTLFLDELNCMSINLQAKILRVVQERMVRRVGGTMEIPVRCRVISSTNVDPWESVNNGSLRKDLFYRLAVMTLFIPPLKDRKEDVEALIHSFLNRYQKIYGFGEVQIDAVLKDIFLRYQWPGNVRELEHIIESAMNMLDGRKVITVDHLPHYLRAKFVSQDGTFPEYYKKGSNTLAHVLREVEKQVIREALKSHDGNITRAAESIGIARQNLQYRIRKLNAQNI
ncbi:sigma-54 interaction domain-containing protein [Desulfosporosinus hippei]|uniref:Arginine utilization regulatory protein n=1 Tax=Desulfosporosinus hippei DSM 8344 TaxID=1121419 RepID=A0A1G8H7S7_9FIRM|nr:sigma 54-interacting transcriptional regulator [Desulfosporosinus hippei]SDI02580.1 arginine utilization regulatory protein [Desulfosporosinus hippei DSM 8344]